MNLMLLVVIIVLAASALIGFWKGLLKTVYSMVAWLIAFVLITFLSMNLSTILEPYLPVGVQLGSLIYLIAVIVAVVIIQLIGAAIGVIGDKVPVLSTVNKIAGLCFGLVRGAVLVWIVFSVIYSAMAISAQLPVEVEFAVDWYAMISESEPLVWIYENNPFLPYLKLFL
ncbi:MAG: CvpA family protein [Clostridiales bacterium]|nr:CvpA family protein [Clostridiales bacterium]